MKPLTPAEIVAIGTAIKGKELDQAKDSLAPGDNVNVDVSIRLTGNLQKGLAVDATSYEKPAQLSLATMSVFCAVLKSLSVGPKRLRQLLEAVDPCQITDNAELTKVFDEVAALKAAELPAVVVDVPGKRGAVTSKISVARV